uniref:Dicer1-like protein n=1 Tax=Psoroptes ovis TaxID=83912 RepID=A0A3B0QYD0_PSOOV|nr:dicer1-like protein [Psoroptes ovis]
MKNIPMMPLLRLSQFYHNCHFGPVRDVNKPADRNDDKPVTDRRMIDLIVDGVGTFTGYGKNKRQCKVSATKKFFEWEKQQEQQS